MVSSAAAPDLPWLSAASAKTLMARGEVRAVDYVAGLLARIDALNPQVAAFAEVTAASAMAAAERADARRRTGFPLPRLHGVAFAVKDLIDVRGSKTSAHSRAPAPTASRSAAAVRRLEGQGAICLGKLTLEEFGIGSPLDDLASPSPRNPWDQARTPGGSSSGSAVAVAWDLTPLALGTDTAGSVRAPAAFCGLTALKPTRGRVDLTGVMPLAPSLDALGPIARSAADCAMMMGSLIDPSQPGSPSARIGLMDFADLAPRPDREVLDAMSAAMEVFASVGCPIVAARSPDLGSARAAGATILRREAYQTHRARLALHGELYGQECRRRLEAGGSVTAEAYTEALRARDALRMQFDRGFEAYDVLALPVTLGAAPRLDDPKGLERAGDVAFRLPFNLLGHPAVVFPTGIDLNGLPLSMQLVGRQGQDETLLALAAAYQTATAWHERRPG